MNYKNPMKAKEIDALLDFVERGKAEGKTLGAAFGEYAQLKKKAKGSVRNLYYDLLKTGKTDDVFYERFLGGRSLKAAKRESFSDTDEKELLLAVFRQKTKGVSVRKVLQTLSCGDDKKMLRYQNKFRNLLVKNRPLVEEAVRTVKAERGECFNPYEKSARRDFLHYKLEKEIDGLYDRLSGMLRQKNKELTAEITRLKEENTALAALLCRFNVAGGEAVGAENEGTGRNFRHIPHKNGNGGDGGCGAQDAEAIFFPSASENASKVPDLVETAVKVCEKEAEFSASAASAAIAAALQKKEERPAVRPS